MEQVKPLSPSAQAVLKAFKAVGDGYYTDYSVRHGIAAVLRHIVDTEGYTESDEGWCYSVPNSTLLSFAEELTAPTMLDRARAALAQEQQWPTDRELLELMPESMRDEFFYAASQCSALLGGRIKPDVFRMALDTAALEYARAVLARWGGAAPQPEVEHD